MEPSTNATGGILSGAGWLEAHHRAKLAERRAFCQRLAALEPTSVLDIGCATGLWLEQLHGLLPLSVRFIGVDIDPGSLEIAKARSASWGREVDYLVCDADSAVDVCPSADLTLLFNMSGYLSDLRGFLGALAARGGAVAIRQYDGATLRFGPMDSIDRTIIDDSLRASIEASPGFRHYDLDRLLASASATGFANCQLGFELFQRVAPFPREFHEYFEGTLDWTAAHLSDRAAELLSSWRREENAATYFTEVDLVAILS